MFLLQAWVVVSIALAVLLVVVVIGQSICALLWRTPRKVVPPAIPAQPVAVRVDDRASA